MKYVFKGSLCGFLCEECIEPLGGIDVLIYLPWQVEKVIERTVASTKDTFRLVTKEESAARKDLLIATSKTDDKGNFEFVLDEKYNNTAFDIDFTCGTVPRTPPKPGRKEPVQFHLTTVFPQWRTGKEQESFSYKWEYCIPYTWWCNIRGYYFDAWVICGHLRNCETGLPIANASVTAWDADFLTDDNLGTAVTDASGHFRIDYTSIQFKQTFLSPWINVETDPGLPLTFQSGPDVYFKAVIGGISLIDEKKADCRKNVGYCLCVDLCSKINVIDPGQPFPSSWTGIGSQFSSSFGPNSYDFDVNGYAGSGKYALTGVIRLTGQAAQTSGAGNRIEYRFLISDTTTPNGTPAPAIGNFTKIIGITPGLFSPGRVASLTKKVPTGINDDLFVFSDQTDFDANGWFDVNNAIERTLVNAGLTIGDLNLFWIIDEDTLISLNTAALTTAPNVPVGAANAGVAVPVANRIPIEKVAIRFEIREVVNKPANIFNVVPGSGKTLNSVIMNNNPVFMKLSIAELETLGSCTPISGDLHAKYTIYHPHLAAALMHLNNNSHSVDRDIAGDGFLTLAGNTNPLVDGHANSSLPLNNPPNDMTKCTYALKLYVQARLHNGESAWGYSGPEEELFFYNV